MSKIGTKKIRSLYSTASCKIERRCFVCNKHRFISHKHHMKSIKECAEELNNQYNEITNGFRNQFEFVPSKVISLCPNCHSYFHKLFYNKQSYEWTMEDYMTFAEWGETIEMREKINELRNMERS